MISKNTLNLKSCPPTASEMTAPIPTPWRILVVDDDSSVHTVTRLILDDIKFENRSVEMLSAYSGKEARELLAVEKNIAVILLDVVMETENAGLQLVKYIREELKDKNVRIILRTGQAGQFPEENIVTNYDINDYKEKNELTAQKLFTSIVSSLRAYSTMFLLDETVDSLKKAHGGLEKMIALANAVQYQKMVAIEEIATIDFLTGLNNRSQLLRLGEKIVADAHHNGKTSLAVAIIDVDDFKTINDTYGLDAGDLVLKEMGASLKQRFLLGDIVAYLGNDAFCVVATHLNRANALELFEQFREILTNQTIQLPTGELLKITVSIGVTLTLRDNLDDMFFDAYHLLDKARESGGNCVVISD